MEDYVAAVLEEMETSKEYTYECSEITTRELHGKEYLTFFAQTKEMEGEQHFFIRRIEDAMMIMTITLHEGDLLEDLLKLSK